MLFENHDRRKYSTAYASKLCAYKAAERNHQISSPKGCKLQYIKNMIRRENALNNSKDGSKRQIAQLIRCKNIHEERHSLNIRQQKTHPLVGLLL